MVGLAGAALQLSDQVWFQLAHRARPESELLVPIGSSALLDGSTVCRTEPHGHALGMFDRFGDNLQSPTAGVHDQRVLLIRVSDRESA